MQGLDEIEKQLSQEWANFPFDNARERRVSHPETGVLARITLLADRHSKPKLRYWFGQIRVDRSTFATLTCPESRCPKRLALLSRWRAQAMGVRQTGCLKPLATDSSDSHLAQDTILDFGSVSYIAREAIFTLQLSCPQKAHPTAQVRLTGWDLFNPTGQGLAGGWDGKQPHLQTIDDARAWLMQHAAELT